jgi:hypothetical protein
LRSFANSTGFKVNYCKSFLVSINLEKDNAQHLAKTVGCQVGDMSFTFLGLPLGTTRPLVEELFPMLSKIQKKMMGLHRLPNY